MKAATHPAELIGEVQRIRDAGARTVTNFFASREQAGRWIARGGAYYSAVSGAALIVRPFRDFHYLYHAAAGADALCAALAGLPKEGTLVSDLVGREEETCEIAKIYRDAGFTDYTRLNRMSRVAAAGAAPSSRPCRSSPIRTAGAVDARRICAFLEEQLDPYRDQMPDEDEVRCAAERGNMLFEERDGAVAGLLFFETTGQTSLLRYWYVDGRFHGEGIGAALIRRYFDLCAACRRFVLWVVDGNDNAVAKYRHYGYREDGLTDRIMIRRGNA